LSDLVIVTSQVLFFSQEGAVPPAFDIRLWLKRIPPARGFKKIPEIRRNFAADSRSEPDAPPRRARN